MYSIFFSKTEYERKLQKLLKKRISEQERSDFVELDDDGEESVEKISKDSETINAYTMYITEVMSAFIFYSDPSTNLDKILPNVKESAAKIIKITKYLIEVTIFS